MTFYYIYDIKWKKEAAAFVSGKYLSFRKLSRLMKDIIEDFDNIPIDETMCKPRVGVVGEAVTDGGRVTAVHTINALNFRFIRDLPDAADPLLKKLPGISRE